VNPALWADITRDLDAATRYAETAVRRAEYLKSHPETMDDDVREDREAAIGLLLHNCYGALERLVHASNLLDDARKVVAQWQAQPERKTFVSEWEKLLSQRPIASAGLSRPVHWMRLV
jgi:hypothetical protein